MFDTDRLLRSDLPESTLAPRRIALELAEVAIGAVEAGRSTRAALRAIREGGKDLQGATIFAFGKAAPAMARAAVAELTSVAGGVVLTVDPAARVPPLTTFHAAHPLPSRHCAEHAAVVLKMADSLGPDQVALALVSGGGSAMLEAPRDGIAVDDIHTLAGDLLLQGAPIGALNVVRQALSRVKGGGLAAAIAPARTLNLVLSDVPGHGPEVVASGPTMRPVSNEALRAPSIVKQFGLWEGLPPRVKAQLTAAPPLDRFGAIETWVVGDQGRAREAVVAHAALQWPSLRLRDRSGYMRGEAREVGAALAREMPQSFVWGGETTVRVTGCGRGGRNQELVLGALLGGFQGGLLLCVGTDGVDGTSRFAGALIDDEAIGRAWSLNPAAALNDNDTDSFFHELGTGLTCGPTGTNVADICIRLPPL